MCSNLGFCPNIDDCTYAHSLDELRINPSYKTKICRFILTKGSCPHGDNCHYAHGEHEVRVHPNYKTEPCYYYRSSGKCPSGAACIYYHSQSERNTSDTMDKRVDRRNSSYKTKLCRFFLANGSCPRYNCHYAHGEHEMRVHPDYKTEPCYYVTSRYYQSSGKCPSGAACIYYHSQSEMRKPGEGERKTSDTMDKRVDRNRLPTRAEGVTERIVDNKMTFNSLGTITDTRFLNYDDWCSFESWVSTPAEERFRALSQSGAGGEIYYSDSEDEDEMRRQCWR